jgi:ammonia channel protein AmtB
MRTAILFFIIGLLLLSFAWWGTNTAAGRAQFDEMAGMIPFGASLAGYASLLIAAILLLLSIRKRRA